MVSANFTGTYHIKPVEDEMTHLEREGFSKIQLMFRVNLKLRLKAVDVVVLDDNTYELVKNKKRG